MKSAHLKGICLLNLTLLYHSDISNVSGNNSDNGGLLTTAIISFGGKCVHGVCATNEDFGGLIDWLIDLKYSLMLWHWMRVYC